MTLYPPLKGMNTKQLGCAPIKAAEQNEVSRIQNNASNSLPYAISPLTSYSKCTSKLYPAFNDFTESDLSQIVTQDISKYVPSAPPYEDRPGSFTPTITTQTGVVNNENTVLYSVPHSASSLIPPARNTSVLYPSLDEITKLESDILIKDMQEHSASAQSSNNCELKSNIYGLKESVTLSITGQQGASHSDKNFSHSTPYPTVRLTSPAGNTSELYSTFNESTKLESSQNTITKDMRESNVSALPPNIYESHPNVYGTAQWVTSTIEQKKLVLYKNTNNKFGFCIKSVNDGIFVFNVVRESAAAQSGLRFGDQILQVNEIAVSGLTADKVRDLAESSNICSVVIISKPYTTTVTFEKDSFDQVGFKFLKGKIIGLVKDSSAARNGLLPDNHLVEVNGVSVIRLNDDDIRAIIQEGGPVITVTVIPDVMYHHIMKISSSLLKNLMDNTIIEV